jgi:acyl-CoA synthetase (AMP-forming)/AMP-acid ligase II
MADNAEFTPFGDAAWQRDFQSRVREGNEGATGTGEADTFEPKRSAGLSSSSTDIEEKNECKSPEPETSQELVEPDADLRVLCVHGWRSNNDVSRLQARHLSLKKWYSGGVHYLEGPVQASGPPDEATAEFFDGPFFSWFERDHPDRQQQLIQSMLSVISYVKMHGPFDCAYGFSQGAGIVALLSHPDVLESLTGSRVNLWKSCFLACASAELHLEIVFQALGISLGQASIPIPSFHLLAIEDMARNRSEAALQMFKYKRNGQIIRSNIYVSSGHGVPSSLARDVEYKREFSTWFDSIDGKATETVHAMGLTENVFGLVNSLGGGSLPWFNKKKAVLVEPQVTRALGTRFNKEMSVRTESCGSTISFRALSLKNERSLGIHQSLFLEEDVEYTKQRPSTLLEALGRLEAEDPLRMSNGMNFRFERTNLALLLADPGTRNTWYSGGSISALLERSPADAPLIRDTANPARSFSTYGDVLSFVSGYGDLRRCLMPRYSHDTSEHDENNDGSLIAVYPAPPGNLGAMVLLTVSIQCAAMPLDPDAKYEDYRIAIGQVLENRGVKNKVIALAFRGFTSDDFVRAAGDLGVLVAWQRPRDDIKPGMYEPESVVEPSGTPLRSKPHAVALLLRTSGSTATPKVVPIRNEALAANAVALAKSLKLNNDDIALNAMPLFHIGGIAASVLASVAGGASLICMDRFETGSFYNFIISGHPTWFTAVPTMHLSLMMYGRQAGESQEAPKHGLRFIRTGAAPLSESDAVALSSFWRVDIVSTYSMTEQMPISSTMSQSKPGTVGNPLLVSMALVDPETLKPVPWGDAGEICISSETVVSEYYNGTGDTKPFFWIGNRRFFRTGDLGLLDDDRFLFIVGRLKELIKMGGEQISPVEIESVVRKHPSVAVAVVFGVPSPTWGEEVGIAVVLHSDSSIDDVKNFTRDTLGMSKTPRYWKVLDDASVLPMTASRKYIRNGLADVLGIQADAFDGQQIISRGVARLSTGLSGLRYLLSVGVMFNHIGAVWQGEDERNPLTWGQNFFPGKASTFYFPATTFFVLGGFSLSAALAGREIKGYWSFISSRFKTLLPLYWFALILALINLLVTCRPSTYSSEFSWQPNMFTRLLPDGTYAQCQSGPVELPYGWWLFFTLAVFILGLQSWFFAFILVGWLLWYSWFFSVYFFVLLVFKWMHNSMVKCRGKGRELILWGVVYTIGVMLSAFALGAYYFFSSWDTTYKVDEAKSLSFNFANVYALSTVLFPPYWIPVVGSGVVAYFLYDWLRPAQSHYRYVYGAICDFLSVFFLLFQLFMFIDIDWPYPGFTGKMYVESANEAHTWDSALDRYVWSVLVERIKTPLIAVWIALLSMPSTSLTSRVLEWRPLSEVLGPTSYGCFLFHQIICQWYWWITRAPANQPAEISIRGMYAVYPEGFEQSYPPTAFNYTAIRGDYTWWNYPKQYYWFSPLPLPVAWFEFFYVIILTTLFAMAMNSYVNPIITSWYLWGGRLLARLFFKKTNAEKQQLGAEAIVKKAIKELVGDDSYYDPNSDLSSAGIASVGLPIFISLLNQCDEHLSLKVSDIAGLQTLGELVADIEVRLKQAESQAGIGEDVL